jgi:hypothetical protein
MSPLLFIQAVAPLIPYVVQIVEKTFPAPKSGKKKRAKAIKIITALAKEVPALAGQLDAISKKVGKQIDDHVAQMNGGAG